MYVAVILIASFHYLKILLESFALLLAFILKIVWNLIKLVVKKFKEAPDL